MSFSRRDFGRPPRKGSLLRRALKMLIRPEGATVEEMLECGLLRTQINAMRTQLIDQKGWDIRTFPCPPDRLLKPRNNYRRMPVVYKVVGKMRWDGTYRKIVRINRDVGD